MSYIIKKNDPLINLKLTDIGRQNLSNGLLNFKYFLLGDSEMNYRAENYGNLNVLRPVDANANIQYPVYKTNDGEYSQIDGIHSIPTVIHNSAKERGFFSNITTERHGLETDLMKIWGIKASSDKFDGSDILECYIDGDTSPLVAIDPGDYIFLKLVKPGYANTITVANIETSPLTYLWYMVNYCEVSGSTLTIGVDRNLPDLSSLTPLTVSDICIYKGITSGSTSIVTNFDEEFPTAYWNEGTLTFTDNCEPNPNDVPIWSFNIYHTQNPVGVDGNTNKDKIETLGEMFGGTFSYLQYAEQNSIFKIGVLHYTNNTVSNFYGEGFFNNTLKLHLPTLMWHKKPFTGPSTANSIGYTFVCDSILKNIGDGLVYYDLIDQETVPTIIGKVFIDQKIIIIEDAEVLAAMSLKSNRNFTLPTPKLTFITPGTCPESSQFGSVKNGETMHVTYMLGLKNEGLWYQPCENIASITNTSFEYEDLINEPKDVLFSFDTVDSSNFAYMFKSNSPLGYTADTVYLLVQITENNSAPDPLEWKFLDATNYLGGQGCLSQQIITQYTQYQLFTDTAIVVDRDRVGYELSRQPANGVLVSVNGIIQKKAFDSTFITYDQPTEPNGKEGNYVYDASNNSIYFALDRTVHTLPDGHPATRLNIGDVIQFHYLNGSSDFGAVQQHVLVPLSIPIATEGEIYQTDGFIYLDLEETPAGIPIPTASNVYVMYNGVLLTPTTNYDVVVGGGYDWRIQLKLTPITGSVITLFYSASTGLTNDVNRVILPVDFSKLTIIISADLINLISGRAFNLGNYILLPDKQQDHNMSFGDENFFFGNVETDIKATIYKTLFTIYVLPNTFRSSINPTFNSNIDPIGFTELGIYDDDNDLVAIGKFSQPLIRRSVADLLVIQASIDF